MPKQHFRAEKPQHFTQSLIGCFQTSFASLAKLLKHYTNSQLNLIKVVTVSI